MRYCRRWICSEHPYRYLSMRRLDCARRLMLSGQSIADAALMAGFFDQSHMARQFTSAYGVPPARWLKRIKQPR
ncbi:helix-turn-helix domain-containing protein [Stenotrophomonas maltophilia group sp. LNF336]